jgi:hypothetical protein
MKGDIDRTVLLDFLITFARSEFALKTGGFAKCGGNRGVAREAQADWRRFQQSLVGRFVSSIDPGVEAACERLLGAPPWELVIADGQVVWQQQQQRPQAAPGDFAADTLTAVRRLRNNLFHGNEAGSAHGYIAAHTEQLLRDAVLVLKLAVSLAPGVKAAYEGATL